MKKLIIFLFILILGYYAFNWYMKTYSPEMNMVRTLEKEFRRAVDNYLTALRQAAEPGLVVISDPERAENQVKMIRAKVSEIILTLSEERAIKRAKKLEREIQTFCEKHQIN